MIKKLHWTCNTGNEKETTLQAIKKRGMHPNTLNFLWTTSL